MSSLTVGSNLMSSTRSDLRNVPFSLGGCAARASFRNASTGRCGWIRKIPSVAAGDVCVPAVEPTLISRTARACRSEITDLLWIVLLLLLFLPTSCRCARCVLARLQYDYGNLLLTHHLVVSNDVCAGN